MLDILKKGNVKNRIFEILIAQNSLSARQVHNQLCKKHAISNTYQSTFKTLKSLLDAKVVAQDGLKYSLNMPWIVSQRDKLDDVISKSLNIDGRIYESENLSVFHVHNLKKVDNFIQNHVLTLAKAKGITITYWKSPHCWWLQGYPIEEEELVEDYKNIQLKCHVLITSNTETDQEAHQYYLRKRHFESVQVQDRPSDNEVVQVVGDHIILCRLPIPILEELHSFYNTPLEHRKITDLLRIINQPRQYELQILHNPLLAQIYKEQITRTTRPSSDLN